MAWYTCLRERDAETTGGGGWDVYFGERLRAACMRRPGAATGADLWGMAGRTIAELRHAVALLSGEFLAGVTLRDAQAFDGWGDLAPEA